MSGSTVKKEKWFKERERTKSGRWRKKRSDAGKSRKGKHSVAKVVLGILVVLVLVFFVIYYLFPELLGLKK